MAKSSNNKSLAENQGISLSSLVKAVADELRELRNSPPDDDKAVIEFTECEIELKVGIKWGQKASAEGEAGFMQIFKLKGGVAAHSDNEEANTIKLKFKALSVPTDPKEKNFNTGSIRAPRLLKQESEDKK